MLDMSVGRQQPFNADSRKEAITSATFKIEWVAGGFEAVFSELAGISSEVEQVEYMEASVKGPMFGRFLGKAKPPTVTLKRSMSTGKDTSAIWKWHAAARNAVPDAYKDTTLKLFAAGGDPEKAVKTYLLTNAIPTKLDIAGMKAGASEVVVQTLTLMCDSIEEAP